jgi:hypothetical protein
MDAEHRERKAANIAWLRRAFSEAKTNNRRGLALLTQGRLEKFLSPRARESDSVTARG